jgi:hypothetical protein
VSPKATPKAQTVIAMTGKHHPSATSGKVITICCTMRHIGVTSLVGAKEQQKAGVGGRRRGGSGGIAEAVDSSPVRRWLFNLATAVSLGLCVAVGVLWVRSGTHYERLGLQHSRWPQPNAVHSLFLEGSSYSATLGFSLLREDYASADFVTRYSEDTRALYPPGLKLQKSSQTVTSEDSIPLGFGPPGFAAYHGGGADMEFWGFSVPDWLPTIVLLVLPTLWLYRFIKARRIRRLGLCPTCGYDLRATPQRCPECGAAAAARRGVTQDHPVIRFVGPPRSRCGERKRPRAA